MRRPFERPAGTAVEFAIVGPITFMLVLGLFVGGLGIFRYQEMARLAPPLPITPARRSRCPTRNTTPPSGATSTTRVWEASPAFGEDFAECTVVAALTWS